LQSAFGGDSQPLKFIVEDWISQKTGEFADLIMDVRIFAVNDPLYVIGSVVSNNIGHSLAF